MSSPPSFSFSKPAMPGDAVSVSVLVEDSVAMAAKWPDIRDAYLPNLLENLRSADPSVQVRIQLVAVLASHCLSADSDGSSMAYDVLRLFSIRRLAHHGRRSGQERPRVSACRSGGRQALSGSHLTRNYRSVAPLLLRLLLTLTMLFPQTLSSATRRQNTTRHLILVAATGPQTHGLNDTTPSGFDPWDDIAIALKQVITLFLCALRPPLLITPVSAIHTAARHTQHRGGNEDVS